MGEVKEHTQRHVVKDMIGEIQSMNVEEFIQHHGVKGMRWGVRRYQPYPKGEKKKGKFLGLKSRAKSTSREVTNLKSSKVSNMDKKSTSDLKKETGRLRLENDLKRLSSDKKVGTKQDKEQYRRRDEMSNEELKRKVDRLQTKSDYKDQAQYANKQTISTGKKVVTNVAKVALPIATGYAASKVSSDSIKKVLKNAKVRPSDIDNLFNAILK